MCLRQHVKTCSTQVACLRGGTGDLASRSLARRRRWNRWNPACLSLEHGATVRKTSLKSPARESPTEQDCLSYEGASRHQGMSSYT